MSRPSPSTEDVAIARKLLTANPAVIALVPIGTGGEGFPVMVRLAQALRALTQGPLGLLRAPPDSGDETANPASTSAPEATAAYEVRPLDELADAAELVLPPALSLGESAAFLARALREASGRYAHIFVDLDGYYPHVREVLDLPDAFVTAARAGRTRERELVDVVENLPTSRHLGTLLLG